MAGQLFPSINGKFSIYIVYISLYAEPAYTCTKSWTSPEYKPGQRAKVRPGYNWPIIQVTHISSVW
jgi:hypothetical protein